MNESHTIIVGGGIMGLSIAWRLAREGQKVTVLERAEVGQAASRVAAGMLAASAEVGYEEFELYDLCRVSLRRWPKFAKEIEADSGVNVDLRPQGTLIVAHDRDAEVALKRGFDFQKEHGYPVEWLTKAETLDVEPFLSPRTVASVRASEDHALDNRMALLGLRKAAESLGAAILEHADVENIDLSGPGVTVRTKEGRTVEGSTVVIAAGPWSRQLSGLKKEYLPPVRPVKGQVLELRMERPFELTHVIRGAKAYLVPRSDGRLIVGATGEEMGFDVRPTAGGVYSILDGAWEMVPGIYDLELLAVDVGLRPGSRDHQPIVGFCEDRRVYIATGHYRHGVILSAVTAIEAAASIISGNDSAVFEYFTPQRFQG